MAAAITERSRICRDDMAALPAELLHGIFRRVGSLKGLFLFAVTSRGWLRRFTDPAFLRGLCPGDGNGHRASLLGFFFQPTRLLRTDRMLKMRNAQRTSVSPPTFRPNARSPLGAMDRPLTSFVADDTGAFNYAEPLAARHGFVLMELEPPTFNLQRIPDETAPLLVAIVNPATGERHVPLPPPGCSGLHAIYGDAIVTTADAGDLDGRRPSPHTTFSQLLLITGRRPSDGHQRRQQLRSYTAATRSWSAPTLLPDGGGGGGLFGMVGSASAAVHQGAAHWLYMDHDATKRDDDKLYKLSVELGTARVAMTKLPVRAGGSPLLCVKGDDQLSIACVYPMHVTVWTQQDAAAAWLRTQVIRIGIAVPHPKDPMQREVWYEFHRGTMLVLYRGGGVFVLDLEKEVMDKVMDCYPSLCLSADGRRLSYVPYEMDLVNFFMSRLGGLCRG